MRMNGCSLWPWTVHNVSHNGLQKKLPERILDRRHGFASETVRHIPVSSDPKMLE